MTYKTILVPLCGSDNDPVALKGAVAVARDFDAHLVGLFVRLDPRDAVPMLGEGMSGAMVDEIMRAAETESNNHRAAARRHFDTAVAEAGFEIRDVPGGVEAPSASWREVIGRIEDVVPAEGRLSDLIVCAHTSIEADTQGYTTMETALLGSARPVLLVPKTLPAEIGHTVAVAWNGKTEATRAVAAALPFLRSADRTHVLTAETSVTEGATGRRIAQYLAWQGVNPELTVLHPGSEPVGETVTKKAVELGADLLVMGGYGHSRMREMILGGVTRYVLNHAGLPVLMAHGFLPVSGRAVSPPPSVGGGPCGSGILRGCRFKQDRSTTLPAGQSGRSREERAMLTIKDCIALSDLTEAEIDAIAEHEHVPEMVAVEMGHCLAHCPGGADRIAHIIADDIAEACAHGQVAHAVDLMHTLREFVETHPRG